MESGKIVYTAEQQVDDIMTAAADLILRYRKRIEQLEAHLNIVKDMMPWHLDEYMYDRLEQWDREHKDDIFDV